LFLSFGHLFFTAHMSVWVWLGMSTLFLAVGLALFAWRQRLAPDDGFLAIMFYNVRRAFLGEPEAPAAQLPPSDGPRPPAASEPARIDTDISSTPRPPPATTDIATTPGAVPAMRPAESWLVHHWFWGSAARRFGVEATEGPVAVL